MKSNQLSSKWSSGLTKVQNFLISEVVTYVVGEQFNLKHIVKYV